MDGHHFMRVLPLLWLLVGFLHCTSSDESLSQGPPGYSQLYEQVLKPGCGQSVCHGGSEAIANLSFDTLEGSYGSLVDTLPINGQAQLDGLHRVKAGQPDTSLLYLKLVENAESLAEKSYGAPMPMNAELLPGPKSRAAIHDWIEAGAPMNGADFEADWVAAGADENYIACMGQTEEELRACFPAEPEGDWLRLYTPPLVLQPNTEHIICSRIDVAVTDELLIDKATGAQMQGGHHTAIFVSLSQSDDFTPIECDQIDMGAMRFVTGAGGAGGQDLTLPDGLALRISPGQQIIVQSHYINSTHEMQVVMDAIDLRLNKVTNDLVIADSLAVIDSKFEIPSGASDYERVKTCTMDQDIDLHLLLGHTHDYGVLFKTELLREGQAPQDLYFATDGPSLRDNPYIVTYDPPLALKTGDQLRITCRWTNTTDHTLGWPEEMCVAFAYYAPGDGFMICDTEDPSPVLITGEETDGCGQPGDLGNELGVGLYCTAEGNECADNNVANFCIAAFSSHNYCTKILCKTDEECGSGAQCVQESAGSACVPDYCD
jgi:hypothetical protein